MAVLVLRQFRQRTVIAVLCFLGLGITFTIRTCLIISTDAIVKPSTVTGRTRTDECSFSSGDNQTDSAKRYMVEWDPVTRGLVEGCFYWGFFVTLVPGGVLSQRYGGATVMGLGAVLASLICIVSPLLIVKLEWIGLGVIGITQGYAQGAVYSSTYVIVAQWIPQKERSTWGATVFSGAQFGYLVSALVVRNAVELRWDLGFYSSGVMGMLWCFAFALLASSDPNSHPYLSVKEQIVLEEYRVRIIQAQRTPWKKILVNHAVWAFVLSLLGHVWMFVAQGVIIPDFMTFFLRLSTRHVIIYLAIGYTLACLCGILSGRLSDFLVETDVLSMTNVRKLFIVFSCIVPGACLLGATYVGCSAGSAVSLLVVGSAFTGLGYSSLLLNPVELSPNYAGALGAAGHSLCTHAGFALHYLSTVITAEGTLEAWRSFMWLTFGIMLVSSVICTFFISANVQDWDKDEFTTNIKTPVESEEEQNDF